MKFVESSLAFLVLAGVAAAQRSFIEYPLEGATLKIEKPFTVQVVRPNSLQGSQEVGIVIGLQSCPTTNPFPCAPPSEQIGSILFRGSYDPQLHEQPGRPYQNFTVTIPNSQFFEKGRAQLSVSRFHLIGAGPSPVLELNNIAVHMV